MEEVDTDNLAKFASEVWPGVWVGAQESAVFAPPDMTILCVSEQRPSDEPLRALHCPILRRFDHAPWFEAVPSALDTCAQLLSWHVTSKVPILVHCSEGVERSPLTVAWWQKRRVPSWSWGEIYELILLRRPVAQIRTMWLPEEYQ